MKVSVLVEESEENSFVSCCLGKGRGVVVWNLDVSCYCYCFYRVWKRVFYRLRVRVKTCGEYWCGIFLSILFLKVLIFTVVSS